MSSTNNQLTAARIAGLAADSDGDDDHRPPIVLLHGLTFDRTMWRPTLAELRLLDDRRRVVALDLPGHGGSSDVRPWGVWEAVHALCAAVIDANLREPVLVGHSISGVIATLYGALFPTSGIVNVDCSLDVEPFARMLRGAEAQIKGSGFAAVWGQLLTGLGVDLLPPSAQQLLGATPARQDVFVAYQHELFVNPPGRMADVTYLALASLRGADVPYRVIAGNEQPAGYEQWLSNALPRSSVEVWPRSGHFPHLADPARFARALADTADWPADGRSVRP